jgi:hypothetical protein
MGKKKRLPVELGLVIREKANGVVITHATEEDYASKVGGYSPRVGNCADESQNRDLECMLFEFDAGKNQRSFIDSVTSYFCNLVEEFADRITESESEEDETRKEKEERAEQLQIDIADLVDRMHVGIACAGKALAEYMKDGRISDEKLNTTAELIANLLTKFEELRQEADKVREL